MVLDMVMKGLARAMKEDIVATRRKRLRIRGEVWLIEICGAKAPEDEGLFSERTRWINTTANGSND